MARIKTALTAKSGEGEANAAQWRRLIDELNLRRRAAAEGGSSKARERHVARGKLLARERVAGLIDPGSPFLEIGALAAFEMYEGDVHGAFATVWSPFANMANLSVRERPTKRFRRIGDAASYARKLCA